MISTAQYQALDTLVRGYLNGITDIALRQAAEAVAEEYIRDIGGIPFVRQVDACGEDTVFVSAPDGGMIASVDRVAVRGETLLPAYWTAAGLPGFRTAVSFMRPAGNVPVVVCARWIPTDATEELPEPFFRAHTKALKDGMLAFLLAQTARPWGDPNTAAHFIVEYDKDKNDARRALLGNAEAGHRASFIDRNDSWI